MMAAVELVLWFLLGLFAPVCPLIGQQDVLVPNHHQGFFKNLLHLPFERRFEFSPYYNVFSSWRTRRPAFPMPDILPILKVPKVQVLCDDSLLTVLVDKRFGGVSLSKEEVQLGDGCFSTKELPHKFIFSYRFNQCGTTHEVKNGFGVFSNSLHFNVREPFSTRRPAPSQVHISCMTTRSDENLNQHDWAALPKTSRTFSMRAMNPSWADAAASNVYKRGQTVHLQISADLQPQEQLFVQSCFISESPEPDAKPRHPIIMNKGCTASLGSPHPVTKFVEGATGVINIELNTTFMIPQMFVHCSVLIADQRISSGSKSCNYNLIQSRWEELSGDVEVCSCCMSKCKGLSVKTLQPEHMAIVTAGPFITEPRPQEPEAPKVDWSMQADAVPTEDPVNTHLPPQTMMVLNGEPNGRAALWLPDQVQADDASQTKGATQKLQTDIESNLKLFGSVLQFHLQPEMVADSHLAQPSMTRTTTDLPDLKSETSVKQEDLRQWPPVIRSKLEISKGKDGSQSLSYEEEVLMNEDLARRIKRKQEQKGMMPTLVDLFRRLGGAE